MDLTRETDIEQLRRVAVAQQIQIEQLLRVLRAKCDELAVLKGSEAELQQTLSLVEDRGLPQEYALNARGERVREGLLHWFHRRGLRYVDFTPPTLPFAERIPVVLRHYANVLRDHAEPVLQDDPRALD